MAWKRHVSERSLASDYFTWQLDRPKPALPSSYFWTWDHSANWVLDDPGIQSSGCYNAYYKRPETYLEDYRRLTDLAAGLGIKGFLIWGFLRDSHGGVEYAKRLCSYAAQNGVEVYPGLGTTWYGGAYYEGDSKYSLQNFLRAHPDARMIGDEGKPTEFGGQFGACLAHPAFLDWLQESIDWLFDTFEIGGVNIENGDFLVDKHPLMQALRKTWPAEDAEPFFHQGMSYKQALDAIGDRLRTNLCAYATYSGFNFGEAAVQNVSMGKTIPAMFKVLPQDGVAQWTLSGMVLAKPLPLTAYLDDGAPDAAFDNPNWPRDLRPPGRRSTGFIHQGSQWWGAGRYQCVVSTIKEGCLRAYRSGLEGVSIHGEVTARHIPYALNYLAFSHFTHWPEDTMRDFGRKTLSQVLGSESEGEAFAEILSHWDAGTLTDQHVNLSAPSRHEFTSRAAGSNAKDVADYQRYRFWEWLHLMARHKVDRNYASQFPF